MLGGVERNGDAGGAAERARPLSAAIDDRLAGDRSLVAGRLSSARRARGRRARRRRSTFTPSAIVAPLMRAPLASDCVRSVGFALPSPGIQTAPARSSVRRIGAIRPASAGDMNSNSTPKLFARAICRFISVRRSFVFATFRLPHCFPAGREAGLLFERGVKIDAVPAHPRCIPRRARLADESRRMPRRAAGEPSLLQQHDVADAELREVIRGRGAGDAAADDDGAGLGWDHRETLARRKLECGSELQRGDPGDHARRPGQSPHAKPSFSKIRADERGEQHRRFAQRGDGGHRRARHRPQHDAVGAEACGAAQ